LIGSAGNAGGAAITRASLAGAEVAIEFSLPAAAADNVRACTRAGCPVVSGTTGWDDARQEVARHVLAAGAAMLWSPNFSLGVNLYLELAEQAATLLRSGEFDAHIVEAHHAAKRDAPSGTARALAEVVGGSWQRAVPVTSV